ncbi:hypothetical protein B9Z35_00875 [Limnohabitans sp. Jir61]|jgi:hypothetical protein|uniref:hypothetical protein n=1 Tax=Limnohabitans sp. Jir61 TaxID=1826168 RepID=UPI000D34ED56|nr:hypothetical protein [Limnohabitans sp. Jir61]PUE32141.1 hypothetical protein B9Z35_00875 [Limnohabitans sp. Jir61]
MNRFKYLVYVLALIGFAVVAKPIGPYPSIQLSELPDPLRSVWKELKPEMDQMSHCATAFDSHSDGEKMAFRCSIHIKMSAEGERRAMRYCEEKRQEKGIKMPCKLVEE